MDNLPTYREPIGRFVVEYHEDLPEEHKAAMRIEGIDPDDNWLLQWSFEDLGNAEETAMEERDRHAAFCADHGYTIRRKWRVRDRGADAPRFIERVCW